MEIWKDVAGYEGYYQVSSYGRVKSLSRLINSPRQGEGFKRRIKEKILNPWNNGNGYLVVTFKINNKRKNKYVHRFVAENFIGKIKKGCVVNHIDFDKFNNTLCNIEVVTQKENVQHSLKNKRYNKYGIVRSDGVFYESITEAAFKNNVCYNSVKSAVYRYNKCNNYYFYKVFVLEYCR